MTPTLARQVDHCAELLDREQRVRAGARRMELHPEPTHQQEAARLFRSADALRRERLELLGRCGLI